MLLITYNGGIDRDYGAGNWKDIKGFDHLARSLGKETVSVGFDPRDPRRVLDLCGRSVTDVIIHYSLWPGLLKAIRKGFPHIRTHVRTHNAEALQCWHRAGKSFAVTRENVGALHRAGRLLIRDMRCRRLGEDLLGISAWDNRNYWRFLPGRALIRHVPYHSPWPVLRPQVQPQPWEKRRNAVVCLAGGLGQFGLSLLEGFSRLARHVHEIPAFSDWTFETSPGVRKGDDPGDFPGPISKISRLDEPWELLCSVKALALLSPLGFGMKTTIVDALAAGCNVLVDKKLSERLLPEIRMLCLPVDLSNHEEIHHAMSCARCRPADHNLNRFLAATALDSLRKSLA